jgi:hypothetical protein
MHQYRAVSTFDAYREFKIGRFSAVITAPLVVRLAQEFSECELRQIGVTLAQQIVLRIVTTST